MSIVQLILASMEVLKGTKTEEEFVDETGDSLSVHGCADLRWYSRGVWRGARVHFNASVLEAAKALSAGVGGVDVYYASDEGDTEMVTLIDCEAPEWLGACQMPVVETDDVESLHLCPDCVAKLTEMQLVSMDEAIDEAEIAKDWEEMGDEAGEIFEAERERMMDELAEQVGVSAMGDKAFDPGVFLDEDAWESNMKTFVDKMQGKEEPRGDEIEYDECLDARLEHDAEVAGRVN